MVHVAAFGYFGMGNLGNEGTLEAFVQLARRQAPAAELRCLAADEVEVTREHGIPARRLMTYRPGPGGGLVRRALKGLSRIWDVPRMWRLTRGVTLLVVPGTGVLESSLMEGPWGLPYWLLLATVFCRLRGGRVALVSIGAEPAPHPVTRVFYRWIVRLSDVSFRDAASRDAVRSYGVRRATGAVLPDLAFALPAPEPRPRQGHVVIGVMQYRDVSATTEKLTEAIARLVETDHTVTLVVGDLADHRMAERIAALVDAPPGRVTVSPASTLPELMAEMAQAEVVVASRFHNVLCALLVARPTVSLSYAPKNRRLLEEFGLGEFDQGLADFDVDLLLRHVEQAPKATEPDAVRAVLERYRAELSESLAGLLERS